MKRMRQERGFTIVELLIAISVFSLVLILITTGVLRFTREYYKGVIAGNTQDVARAIVDDVTRSIQFNGGNVVPLTKDGNPITPTNPVTGYCVGSSKRYRFYLNSQITSGNPVGNQGLHAFIADQPKTNCTPNTAANDERISPTFDASVESNARELLGDHMRLAKFSISGGGDLWTVNVRVVYGDDDLLCDPGTSGSPGGCGETDTGFPKGTKGTTDNLSCRPGIGTQFCAVSELTTTINKRVKSQ